MRIYNLTEGEWKYDISIDELSKNCHNMIMQAMAASHYPLRNFMYKKYLHTRWRQEMDELLNAVPIFLVNTSQSGLLEIPDQDLAVVIPDFDESNYGKVFRDPNGKPIKESSKDDALSKWIDNIGIWLEDPSGSSLMTNCIVNRQLGEHQYNGSHTLMPSRIFIWVDAVSKEAGRIDKVLFLQFVILHEYAHALMSVRLYGAEPCAIFCQADRGDSYIEEPLANAFALQVLKSKGVDIDALLNFTRNQPIGYDWASAIIDNKDIDVFKVINEWMRMKVMIDDMTKTRLQAFNNKRLNEKNIDFNQLLPQEGKKYVDMFYPMGIHFRERYYGNVSFEAYPMIYTSEDGGIWYSSEFKKQRSGRVFHYDNGKTKLVDDDHTKSFAELIEQ